MNKIYDGGEGRVGEERRGEGKRRQVRGGGREETRDWRRRTVGTKLEGRKH